MLLSGCLKKNKVKFMDSYKIRSELLNRFYFGLKQVVIKQ